MSPTVETLIAPVPVILLNSAVPEASISAKTKPAPVPMFTIFCIEVSAVNSEEIIILSPEVTTVVPPDPSIVLNSRFPEESVAL